MRAPNACIGIAAAGRVYATQLRITYAANEIEPLKQGRVHLRCDARDWSTDLFIIDYTAVPLLHRKSDE